MAEFEKTVDDLRRRGALPEEVARTVLAAYEESLRAGAPAIPADAGRFGKFALAQKIAEGGMGEVWKAWQFDLGRWVALKFVRPGGEEDRLLHEARTAAKLSHPNIVATYEAGVHDGRPYIAMDFIDGTDLRSAQWPARRAIEAIVQVAEAVHFAHERGIIHRDLKPANLMVDAAGRVLVTDFGLAKSLQAPSGMSVTGEIVGTPAYMPPEQAAGRRADARSDVYGLGATLYALLTSRPPFEAETILALLRRIESEEPPSLRRFAPDVDADVETIVAKAMEKDPARRYASAREMAEDLRRVLHHEPIRARPASAAYRLRMRIRRQPLAWALGAALAAALIGGIGFGAAQLIEQARLIRRLEQQSLLERAGRRLREIESATAPLLDEAELAAARAELESIRSELAAGGDAEEPAVWLMKGQAAMMLQRERDAIDDFSRALELEETEWSRAQSVHAAAALGRALARKLVFEDAIVGSSDREKLRLREAALRDHMPWIRRDLRTAAAGHLPPWARDVADMLEAFAQGHDADVESIASEGIKRGGRNAEYYAFRASLRFSEPEIAIEALDAALDRNSAMPRSCFQRGKLNQTLGRLAEAHADFSEAIRLKPDYGVAYSVRGGLRRRMGDLDGATSDLERATELMPDDPRVLNNRGNLLTDLGRLDDALADFDRAVLLDPLDPTAYVNRGVVHYKNGDLDAAIADYSRAIELDKGDAMALNNRANALLDRGDLDGAEADYTRAIESDPDYARAFLNRGNLRRRFGRPGSMEDYSRAIELDPSNSAAYDNRGIVRAGAGDVEGAAADFGRAIELDPSYAPSYSNRAVMRLDSGDLLGAVEDFEKFLELAPDHEQAGAVRRQVEILRRRVQEE